MRLGKLIFAISTCTFIAMNIANAEIKKWPRSNLVNIVVPYPPGTEPDILARDLGQRLNKITGANFVIENKPGANTIIGTSHVVRSKGDGNTLLMIDSAALASNPLLYKDVPYDWKKDLKIAAEVGKVQLVVGASKRFEAHKDFTSLIKYAQKNPGKVNVGTGGRGHINHLGMAMLAKAANLELTYVPYKGVSPAVNALLSGEVDVVMAGALALGPNVKSGNITALVTGGEKRNQFLPQVPTVKELGYPLSAIPSTVFTLVAPGKTEDQLVESINRTINQVTEDAGFRRQYESRGMELLNTSPAHAKKYVSNLQDNFQTIISDLGLKQE